MMKFAVVMVVVDKWLRIGPVEWCKCRFSLKKHIRRMRWVEFVPVLHPTGSVLTKLSSVKFTA